MEISAAPWALRLGKGLYSLAVIYKYCFRETDTGIEYPSGKILCEQSECGKTDNKGKSVCELVLLHEMCLCKINLTVNRALVHLC